MEPIIRVEHLVKRYAKATTPAVDDISFDVAPGELFAFLGPNGAGKTTTISILTTTLAKTSGTVTIAGHDLDREATAVRRQHRDHLPEAERRPPPFGRGEHPAPRRPLRHLRLPAVLSAMPAEYRQRIEQLAEVVGLGADLHKPLKTFSGGMKRKLEIVRSLMHRPRVLFLDEPTSGLDPISRAGLWSYLREVRNQDGTTVFLTTHYLDEAEDADRVCVIDHGRISVLGTPDDLKRSPARPRDPARRRRPPGARGRARRARRDRDRRPERRAPRRRTTARPPSRSSPALRDAAVASSASANPVSRRPTSSSSASPRRPSHDHAHPLRIAPSRRRALASLRREVNATFAIAWREVLRAVKSPMSIAFTIIFPILFIGILGGSISQNLAGALPFALPAVHAHRHGRQHHVPGHHHRASRTSSKSARTTSPPSSSWRRSRATPCSSAS